VLDCEIIYILLITEHNGDVSPENYAFYVNTAANQNFARMCLWAGLHTLRAAGRTRTTEAHCEACGDFWE
jgi:hypothetical protein